MTNVINLNERAKNGTGEERPILPTDSYRMKVIDAKIEENNLAKPNRDGSKPLDVVITWEITVLTDEQREVAEERGEDWDTVRVWQRLNPYYGDVKDGGPSKFKAFIDLLRKQGHLQNFSLEAFDVETLVGIEQKVSVLEHIKTMGPNAGKPGNKVAGVAPLRKARNTPQPVTAPQATAPALADDEELF